MIYQCGDWINHISGGHGFVIGLNPNWIGDPQSEQFVTVLYMEPENSTFTGRCVNADTLNFIPVTREPTDDDWRRFGLHMALYGDQATPPGGESV